MSDERTRALIQDLTRDLTPVERIPPPGAVAIGVAAGGALALGSAALWRGLAVLPPGAAVAFFAALAALILAAAGAAAFALTSSIPGREVGRRRAALLAATGGAAFVAAGLLYPEFRVGAAWLPGARCAGTALLLGVLPALPLVAFLRRARPLLRARGPAAMAAIAAAAAGAVAAHATCPAADTLHVWVGHGGIAVASAALLGLLVLAPRLLRPAARA